MFLGYMSDLKTNGGRIMNSGMEFAFNDKEPVDLTK